MTFSLTGKPDLEQVQGVEDDGGDDTATDAGQEVLVLGRAHRRQEAGDAPEKEVAAGPGAAAAGGAFAAHPSAAAVPELAMVLSAAISGESG